MKFEQIKQTDGRYHFSVVNEQISVWDDVLKDVKGVKRAAAICSGGEVAFFNILPKVEESLECIDNSFGSMYFAIGKYHAIEKLGAEKAHALFCSPQKPASMSMHDRYSSLNYDSRTSSKAGCETSKRIGELFAEGNGKWPSGSRYQPDTFCYGLAKAYKAIPVERLKEFRANRTKITFIHGDLSDLKDRGPYDLVYLSNALEYTSAWWPAVRESVREGGYVACTGNPGALRGLKLVAEGNEQHIPVTEGNVDYPYYWRYSLFQNTPADTRPGATSRVRPDQVSRF